MPTDIKGEDVQKILAHANEVALQHLGKMPPGAETYWHSVFERLVSQKTPRTYTAVFAVLLTARALRGKDELDVRQVKKGAHPLGYSAPSIGSKVSTFAKEQNIDLRATSSQPMNNQPFTFVDVILPEMGVQNKFKLAWEDFYKAICELNELTTGEAQDLLAAFFDFRRRTEKPQTVLVTSIQGMKSLDELTARICSFVDQNSESGKVGQAFISALYSLVYPQDLVIQGDSQDPDASTPGDVHVTNRDGIPWLWIEVKQKVIATGEVKGYLKKVVDLGGDNVVYFALKNSKYSGNIQEHIIYSEAARKGARIRVFQSPEQATSEILPNAQGRASEVAEAFAANFYYRLHEANSSEQVIQNFKLAVAGLIEFT